jgi:hypothetical protein
MVGAESPKFESDKQVNAPSNPVEQLLDLLAAFHLNPLPASAVASSLRTIS